MYNYKKMNHKDCCSYLVNFGQCSVLFENILNAYNGINGSKFVWWYVTVGNIWDTFCQVENYLKGSLTGAFKKIHKGGIQR